MKRRPISLHPASPVSAVLFAVLLVACGGSSDDNGGGTDDGMADNQGGTTAGSGGGTSGNVATTLSQPATLLPRTVRALGDDTLISVEGRARAATESGPLAVIHEVVENHGSDTPYDCAALGAAYGSCSVTNLHIKDADGVLAGGDWKLYFHSIKRILRVDSDELDVAHVNGDLHVIMPDGTFDGFEEPVETIRFITEFSQLIESDFMPRYWLVRDDEAPLLIPNTDSDTDERPYSMPLSADNAQAFDGESVPVATPATRFAANADVTTGAAALSADDVQTRIIPRPSAVTVGAGTLDISGGISFAGGAIPAAAVQALAARQQAFLSIAAGTALASSIDASLGAGAYRLTVDSAGISLIGGDDAGLFHAAQSVLALVKPGTATLPYVTVDDAPRLSYRGMHLDVARNFQSVATVKRLIDQMAAYKLNVLHLHLSDDEGFRLEIPSLPELAAVGGRRAFELDANGNVFEGNALMPQLGSGPGTDNAGTGHFSRAEFVDLLRYATARYITVVPEFDMPGHARAAVVAMRARASNLGTPDSTDIRLDDPGDTSRYRTIQNYKDGILNPCLPGTYAFIDTLISEVATMYGDAGAPLEIWHMGGDEANNIYKGGGFGPSGVAYDDTAWDFPWEGSPACAAFIEATPGVDSLDDLQAYFVKRVSGSVAGAGIPALYAWMDILDGLSASDLATTRAGVDFWEVVTQGGYDRVGDYTQRGFEIVITSPDFTYFDMSQEAHPDERGVYWATRFTDTAKVFGFAPENLPQNAETSITREGNDWEATGTGPAASVQGLRGHVWTEVVRTGEQVDYLVYPRLLALAERAWHRAAWELDYAPGVTFSGASSNVDTDALTADHAGFAAALGSKELPKLDAAGVRYRIPVPGAVASGGTLDMNMAVPGLALEVAAPDGDFVPWNAARAVAPGSRVRARAGDGRAGRADTIE